MGGSHTVRIMRPQRDRPALALVARWLPLLSVLGVTLAVVSRFFFEPPFSHDHPPYIFKAWHFWTEMLGRGRLRGWSPYWAFGFPYGDLTPFGSELWVASFRAGTFGLLSWPRTYGLAFAGALTFATLAMYSFARRRFGAAAGVVAAVLWILDPGAWAQGGWYWHTTYGVWPVTLSMAFLLLALGRLEDVLARGRRADVACSVLWMCGSLLVHQLSLFVYPVIVSLMVLDRALRPGGLSRAALVRLAATCALSLALPAFYLVPMLARTGATLDLGVQGISLDELGLSIAEMRIFENMWPPVLFLGGAGAVIALRGKPSPGFFMVSCALVFVLMSSNVLISVVHAQRLMNGFLKVEAQRMLLVAKLFWLPLAGHAAVAMVRTPLDRLAPSTSRSASASASVSASASRRRALGLLFVCAVVAPAAMPAARYVYRAQVLKEVQTAETTPYWRDLQPFFAWSRAIRARTPDFYRIAYDLPMHDHTSLIAPVFNQTLLYKVGYTPTQIFRGLPMTAEPALYEALSVRYVLSDHSLPRPDFVLERTFGQLQVYRFTRYRPEPFTLIGSGRAEVLRFDPELVQLRLRGTTSTTRVRLHVAIYPSWEATLDGKVVPITPAPVYGSEYPFLMEVPAGADGVLTFRYVRRAPDIVGLILTGLGAVTLLVLLAGHRFYALAVLGDVARRGLDLAASVANRAAMAGLLVAGALVAWRLLRPGPPLAADSVFQIRPEGELRLGGSVCKLRDSDLWVCGPYPVRVDVVSGWYGSHVCLTAPEAGPLTFSSRLSIGRFVAGSYDPSSSPGRIRVSIDGQAISEMATRGPEQGLQFFQVDTRAYAGKVAELRVELEGAPLQCFDVRRVE